MTERVDLDELQTDIIWHRDAAKHGTYVASITKLLAMISEPRELRAQSNEGPVGAGVDRAGLEADVRFLRKQVGEHVPGGQHEDAPEQQAFEALARIAAALGVKEPT